MIPSRCFIETRLRDIEIHWLMIQEFITALISFFAGEDT